MATPSVVGYTSKRETYGTGTFSRPAVLPTGTLPGDVLVFSAMIAGSAVQYDTTGWTVLQATKTVGTRSWITLAKVYTTGQDVPTSFTTTAGGGHTVAVVAIRGVTLDGVIGLTWDRPTDGTAATDNRTIGRAVSYSKDSLILTMHGESTSAVETADPYVTVTGGTIIGVQDFQAGTAGSNLEKVLATYNIVSGSGTSEQQVATWQNAAQNGIATVAAFPAASSAAAPTGNVLHASAAQFASDSLRVSVRMIDPARTTQVRTGAQTRPVTLDTTTGYGWVDLTGLAAGTHTVSVLVDGVVQTDWTGSYTLMPTVPASFKAVAGSCQVTGSNHPIFDAMKADNPLFLAHMGDLHYQNATTEPLWRAGVNTSLETDRVKNMLSSVQLHWQWDNHDRIMIDTLNLGTTDPATLTQWRKYAGTSGWPLTDTNNKTWVSGRVRFISTDHWTVRDDPDLVAEPRTFLGAAQKQWFKDTLAAATEPVIVWFTQWTGQNNANGRWNSFIAETTELENWIDARPEIKSRMILIGGDSHSLQADSGTRSGSHRFVGLPNLNISGFNQASSDVSGTITPPWDIACRTLQDNPETESQYKYGGYSLISVDDNGTTLNFKWDGVRVDDEGNRQVLATYTRTIGGGTVVQKMYIGDQLVDFSETVSNIYLGDTKVWSAN